MIKPATMCMNQRPIKRRDMHVGGFDSELHETRIQYKHLNMHNHSLSSKGKPVTDEHVFYDKFLCDKFYLPGTYLFLFILFNIFAQISL
jgi:hypothetical protein